MNKQPLFGHILTLILGGFIYISFRAESLTMFKWFATASLDAPIARLRAITLTLTPNLPNWFLYSLPDGIWVFSYISLMLLIWKNKINQENIVYIFSLPLIAILSEIGQLFKIVPGTFDTIDILFYILGTFSPFIFYTINLPTLKTNTKCTKSYDTSHPLSQW